MATSFKTLTANDISNTRTILHEAIPLTGTISSGTYADANIKTYSHGMFTSVYDYPYLSSSANHVFDIATGFSANSAMSGSGDSTTASPDPFGDVPVPQQAKKINIYTQMAQVLMGYDAAGAIQDFDQDGDLASGGAKLQEVFFINFARLLGKDELKKGSFQISFITGGLPSGFGDQGQYTTIGGDITTQILTLGDYSATSSYYVNSPAGEYGILYTSSAGGANGPGAQAGYGLLFYQAGIAVITGSIWANPLAASNGVYGGLPNSTYGYSLHTGMSPTGYGTTATTPSASWQNLLTASSATLDDINNAVRNRIQNISFNNTVELNSTIYFCRVGHNEFNYSANPTYLDSSKIRVKNATSDNPVSYITTVGLYSSDNELLAVAKLSEPLKKDPNTELTLRVRLDY
jgi:hypothetical protein